MLGSTNLSEWANFRSTASTSGWSAVGGQTRNPFDPDRNTSGSSSGSAAAIAAGLAPLAVGTETDGSIVSPAGVCGVVGFKPTLGRVPGAGIVPISSRQDTAGPMARTVADAAALFAVLSGGTPHPLPVGSLAGRRVALWRPDGMTDDVTAVFDAVADRLRRAGCALTETRAATSSPFEDAEFQALLAEFSVELPAYLRARPGEHPRTWERAAGLQPGRRGGAVPVLRRDLRALRGAGRRGRLRGVPAVPATPPTPAAGRRWPTCSATAEFALAPTNSPAWPISYGAADEHGLLTSSLCAVTGSPSISLPAGTAAGLPIGVSVLGRHGEDERLLAFAADLQAVLPRLAYPLD